MHENAVLTIGLRDQSYYSICHFIVRLFIPTVEWKLNGGKDFYNKLAKEVVI